MNKIMITRFGIIALGGVAGGIAGYFLASLILDQIAKSQEEFEWDNEENTNTEVRVGKPEVVKNFKNPVVDYTKFAEKGVLSELVKPYTPTVNSKQDNIRIISLEEYDSEQIVSREMVSYYAGDTTFSNENEELIPNPEDFFVPNVHLHFGEESEDPDIVYVKNENNGVSYEITRIPGKYSVIVMGEPDEGLKGTKAKRRRSTKTKASEESIDNEGEE